MHLKLGEPFEKYIDEQIRSGFYGSAVEVVRDALRRRMEDSSERARIASIHGLVNTGKAQIENGEGVAYTPDLMDDLAGKAKSASKSGKTISDVVKPG